MFDVLAIAALVDEANASLIDARIQQVLQIDALTIALEVYALRTRRWLLLSAHPEQARVLLTARRQDADPQRVSPLLLLLRKYARGGRIIAVTQPLYERSLQFSIAKVMYPTNRDADDADATEPSTDQSAWAAEPTFTDLHVELMGRRSNIIFVDADGEIMDAIKRVTPDMSRVRPIRPHLRYIPPPPLSRADPLRASTARVLELAEDSGTQTLTRWLVASFLGVSPLLAREVASRAALPEEMPAAALDAPGAVRLADALQSVYAPLETAEWQPTLYRWSDGRADFSAIRLQVLERAVEAQATPCDTIFQAIEMTYESGGGGGAQQSGSAARHAARREQLVAEIDTARERVRHRLHALAEQAERAREIEHWREMGEAIYVWISTITAGQRELTTPEGLVIPLDPNLSASQNAQEYFERYRKAQSAEQNLPQLQEAAQHQLDYLDQLRALVHLADGYDEIETLRLEWIAWADATGGHSASRATGARPSKQARRPRTVRTVDGYTIAIGRSGPQNDTVTFEMAAPRDLWLHARGMPGAHIILRTAGDVVPAQVIEQAAALAAWYSNGRGSTTVPVDVTPRRYVRKIKGAGPGMVTYRNEYTVQVRPQSEHDLGLS